MAERDEIDAAFRALMEAQRSRCLWYFRSDWQPATVEEMLRVLDAIERHGDRAAFLEAARIRAALAAGSSLPSAIDCG
jgi:hypothetical protein